MTLCITTETDWRETDLVTLASPTDDRRRRILAALAADGSGPLAVDDGTLRTYYQHLASHLRFPFTAYYLSPNRSLQQSVRRCVVLELLDPARFVTDEFDGLVCKVRRGKYEIYLPLIELELPQHSRNFRRIEDYWHWFSNCRQ